ncbi:hypothetical protein DQP55_24265 [Mycolicibacterium sp. GF69]|uniref:hypothetical protein n=1 Tax=Mycolicibacterium sp. GF69 TaxID=2267251 RepID=UPI000DCCDAF0|nr:hypothetical protein [Mycolicibacterium sp. GF69]RAV06126.1 hypothetical protein DQP55_24265 [Mycolicibacterium sp. GF69]
MSVNPAEIFKSLHPSRLAHYRSLSGGQDADALALYEWNIEVAAALQDPLGIAEVAVRHAIDTQLCGWSQQHVGAPEWIDHRAGIPYLSAPNVFTATRHNLYKAADQSRRARPANHPRHGGAITHDDLVAHVMFGTWANLLPEKFDAGWLDPNGQPVQNPVNLQARRDLWRNCLHGGFPHVQHDPRGYGTGNKVRDLRKLRNRVSHMDSLLYVDVRHQHDRVLLPLLNSISHELRDWVVGRSKVQTVLTQRPTTS